MAVGCGGLEHRLIFIRYMEENAVQIVARFFGRNRKTRLVDNFAQRRSRQFKAGRQLALGNDREIIAWQRCEIEARPAGIHCHLAICRFERDLAAFGQLTGDIEQCVCGNGGSAGLFDLRLDGFDNLEIKIRGHQLDPAAVHGFDQNIGQNRNGVAAFNHRLHMAQALQKHCPFNRRFHRHPLRTA